jgi:hypothetical protein
MSSADLGAYEDSNKYPTQPDARKGVLRPGTGVNSNEALGVSRAGMIKFSSFV